MVTRLTAEKLRDHQGHLLVATSYGKSKRAIVDYSLECEDCSVVLADFERR